MTWWFLRGLRHGIITTHYPTRPEPSVADLPSPPTFVADLLTPDLVDRLVADCPNAALRREDDTLVYDVGAWTSWNGFWELAGPAARPCGTVELAATRRDQLIKRIPLAGTPRNSACRPSSHTDAATSPRTDEGPSSGADGDADAERLRRAVSKQFRRSLNIRTLDTGSGAACESEIRMLSAPHYDLHRLGFFFTPSPRHADLLMVTGPGLRVMDEAVAKTYAAMPDPKLVIAVGAGALGGVYPRDEFAHGSVDEILPVDVWVPGSPPSPVALLQGLLVAVGRLAEKVSEMPFYEGRAE